MKLFLESCCTSIDEVQRACDKGACRIELCERIDLGGVTPSRQLVAETLKVATIPVNVMIRPRGGNFVYTKDELRQMAEDIRFCKSVTATSSGSIHFVNGVVFGALTQDNQIDTNALHFLVKAVKSDTKPRTSLLREKEEEAPQITFHRAFDNVADPQKALEDIIASGCTHLLTSGNMEDAFMGRFNIAKLVAQAAGRITVIAGKGIRKSNLQLIAEDSKAPQLHGTNLF